MMILVSLLVAAALVSQHSCFEANAQQDNSQLLDNNLQPNFKPNIVIGHPKKARRVIRRGVNIISAPDKEIRRLAGERLELQCKILGNPAPAVIWEKNGQRLDGGYEEEINEILPPVKWTFAELHTKLIITSTTPGEDTYTCIAISGTNKSSASSVVYTLPVEDDEADLLALQKLYLLTPTITSHYKNIIQAMGTSVVLPCRVFSFGKYVISWQGPRDQPIYDNPRMKVLPSGDLLINDLDFDEDMGNYTCVAKNMFGKDTTTTYVYPTRV